MEEEEGGGKGGGEQRSVRIWKGLLEREEKKTVESWGLGGNARNKKFQFLCDLAHFSLA